LEIREKWIVQLFFIQSGVPFQLVCWCWCFAGVGEKQQQLTTANQQNPRKVPANHLFSIFFQKNIFKIFFFANFVLLSHLGTKANFYLKLILGLGGTKKCHFW